MKLANSPYKANSLQSIRDIKNLLVVVAMESEEKSLISGLQFAERTISHRLLITVKDVVLPSCHVAIARSGVGLVNAGILVALAAEKRRVDAIVLLGVGGALDDCLEIGDIVVARQVIQHDSIRSSERDRTLIAPGELTLSRSEDDQVDPIMPCDSVLVDWITDAATNGAKAYQGTILSGSEFAAHPKRKVDLRNLASDALLVDMEAAGCAQIARKLGIPFVAAKTVADRVSPSTSIARDYIDFLESASRHSAALMHHLLTTFA